MPPVAGAGLRELQLVSIYETTPNADMTTASRTFASWFIVVPLWSGEHVGDRRWSGRHEQADRGKAKFTAHGGIFWVAARGPGFGSVHTVDHVLGPVVGLAGSGSSGAEVHLAEALECFGAGPGPVFSIEAVDFDVGATSPAARRAVAGRG